MNKRFGWLTRPTEINETLFIMNPKISYVKPRPSLKSCKVIELTLHEINKLQYENLEKNLKQKAVKENKCKWIKMDGCVCNALLKHGNKYCVRHMKLANKT